MKIKILCFLVIALQSCSMDGYVKERDQALLANLYFQNDSAIIITKTNAKSISTGALSNRYGKGFTEMNWCKEDKDFSCKEILYFSPYTKKKTYGQYSYSKFYNIKAGKYYLDEIKENKNYTENPFLLPFKFLGDAATYGAFIEPNFNTSISGWNKKQNAANYASFETNPGEIVYIGDLDFTFTKQKYWLKGKINLEVSDNYNDAVAYFRAKHPEYKDKPVIKRLAKPGILLGNYDAGFFW